VSALATLVAVATDEMWVAVPAVAVVGLSMSTAGIAIQTSIQLATDRAMRGRVMGLYGLIFRGAPAVGALSAGLVSAYFAAAASRSLRRAHRGRGLLLDLSRPQAHLRGFGSTAPGFMSMTKMDGVYFDLDGTLTDPKIGITRSIKYGPS